MKPASEHWAGEQGRSFASRHVGAHQAALAQALGSVKGIGPATIATLLAELPELSQLCRRKIAALVSVAPLNRDSGQMRGQRAIWGGRADVRRTLYLATLVAVRHSPVFEVFYERLVTAGKSEEGPPSSPPCASC